MIPALPAAYLPIQKIPSIETRLRLTRAVVTILQYRSRWSIYQPHPDIRQRTERYLRLVETRCQTPSFLFTWATWLARYGEVVVQRLHQDSFEPLIESSNASITARVELYPDVLRLISACRNYHIGRTSMEEWDTSLFTTLTQLLDHARILDDQPSAHGYARLSESIDIFVNELNARRIAKLTSHALGVTDQQWLESHCTMFLKKMEYILPRRFVSERLSS